MNVTETAAPSPAAVAQPRPMERLRGMLAWVLQTFGPLLAFWVALRLGGLVTAIVVSLVVSVFLLARTVVRERRVSPFTAFIAASVAVFGVLDLHYRTGFFVKLEPALGNVATGAFFLGSILWKRPVVIELAERASGRPLPQAHRYLTVWTALWAGFFFVRASVYVWMAYRLSLEHALGVRAVIGPLSFGGMFVAEGLTRRLVFPKRGAAPVAVVAPVGPASEVR